MDDVGQEAVKKARTPAGAPQWFVLGLVIGLLGYLSMTGAVCGEGLAAAIVGGVAGVVWAEWSARRHFRRYGRFLGGLVLIASVTIASGLMGRALAPRMIFHRAFGVSPDASVHFVETDRFGFMDNTSLVIFKIDEPTLSRLLSQAEFARDDNAEQSLAAPHDEQVFRREASIDGVFADKLPYNAGLKVYQRTISKNGMPAAQMTVTWDPKEQKAYVLVADY